MSQRKGPGFFVRVPRYFVPVPKYFVPYFVPVPSKSTKMFLFVELKVDKVEIEGHFSSSAGG